MTSDCVYFEIYIYFDCYTITFVLELLNHLLPPHRSQQAYNFQNLLIYVKPKNDITVCVSIIDILFYILNIHFVWPIKTFRKNFLTSY